MIFYLDESLEGEKCPDTVPEFRERPGTEEKGIQERILKEFLKIFHGDGAGNSCGVYVESRMPKN